MDKDFLLHSCLCGVGLLLREPNTGELTLSMFFPHISNKMKYLISACSYAVSCVIFPMILSDCTINLFQ